MPGISVVIPTYNSASTIADCLRPLMDAGAEVLVVDDGSSDDTVGIARRFDVRVIRCGEGSAAAARNMGLRSAEGDIILFTDSDCIPPDSWVHEFSRAFASHPDADIIGGQVRHRRDSLFRRVHALMYELKDAGEFADDSIMLPAMNLGVRRHVFAKVMFDPTLPGALCDDVDFLYRARRCGYRIRYIPSITLLHLNPATLAGFVRQEFRHGLGHREFQVRHPECMSGSETTTIRRWVMSVLVRGVGHPLHLWNLAQEKTWTLVLASGLYWFKRAVGDLAYLKRSRGAAGPHA